MAASGMASVKVEFASGTDMDQAISDVESAVDLIDSFPARAEQPQIKEMTNRQSMMRLVLYGDISERALKEIAHQTEESLAKLPSVSLVEASAVRNYEISIDVPLDQLRALGLSFREIAEIVAASSLELSAGSLNTDTSRVRLRTIGQRYDQQDFEDIVLIANDDGTLVRLGDVASVRDTFEDLDLIVRHQGSPAVFIEVHKAEGEQVMDVANSVHKHIETVVAPALPEGVALSFWNDESQTYSERINLLLKNGILGLLLVFVALSLFMQIRLAVWVVAGLTTTFVGALAVMLAFDLALNTISVFVFVLAIGIIVDDAIVVSDSIHAERKRGLPGLEAAMKGAQRVRLPLTFAVLTSAAAFFPLLFIPGGVGEVWRPLPIIVIGMLFISLIESLFILPSHLSHLPGPDWQPNNAIDRFLHKMQSQVDAYLSTFVHGPLQRGLEFATAAPSVIIAGALGFLILCVSLIPAGIVPTTFADVVEGDFVTAHLEMPEGTTARRTLQVAEHIEAIGLTVVERISKRESTAEDGLLSGVMVAVGQEPRVEGGGVIATPTLRPPANVATIELKLVSAQIRDITTTEVAKLWRAQVGTVPSARSVTFSGEVIDFGNPVEIALSHPDEDQLAHAASLIVGELQKIAGVFDVRSDHSPGVKELQLELRPEARSLGITLQDLAAQVRTAFFGAEALRVQRGDEEVRVYVRLPAHERGAITDLERFLIRTPTGAEVPLSLVAEVGTDQAPSAIRRKDSQRVVTVTAEVEPSVISAGEANGLLLNGILPGVLEAYPDLTYTYGGEQQQQIDSIGSLQRGFLLAMVMIFILLAFPLRSYTKPFIVMSIIPFGLIGVIIGHLVLQIPISAATIMGVLGLSGVLVNDSLVMVNFIDERRRQGDSERTAIIEGAKGRFRPIMLTSVTTFLGFTPLILENAIQAQFMMPFAASLGIGILVTTVLLMLLVPAICMAHAKAMSFPRQIGS